MANELNKILGQKLGNFEKITEAEAEAQTPILGTYRGRGRGLGRVLVARSLRIMKVNFE